MKQRGLKDAYEQLADRNKDLKVLLPTEQVLGSRAGVDGAATNIGEKGARMQLGAGSWVARWWRLQNISQGGGPI
jgi:hypothetical protein